MNTEDTANAPQEVPQDTPSGNTADLTPEQQTELELQEAELDALKGQADRMGLQYHPSIGIAKLKARIKEVEAEIEHKAALEANGQDGSMAASVPKQERTPAQAKAAAMSLVRVQITCMDPTKKAYPGELITAGNSVVGTVRKMVPFGRITHIPRIMFNILRDKEYVQHVETPLPNGQIRKDKQLVKAYAVAELPPLTPDEIQEIADRQASRNQTAEN